jgi:hypothetical protein
MRENRENIGENKENCWKKNNTNKRKDDKKSYNKLLENKKKSHRTPLTHVTNIG